METDKQHRGNVQCQPGEGVDEAAFRGWGSRARVVVFHNLPVPVYSHNMPERLQGKIVLGTVTVRRGESYPVVDEES